ncbi:MAG TPA: hypothetical protein VMT64_08535, partial [Candidatus Binataceae bacterium]|nr:hypothetical protein [Candidatus Binataceae bacterium]
PPLATAAVVAFMCYWVVILWPSSWRRRSNGTPGGKALDDHERRVTARKSRKNRKPAAAKQAAQLRMVGSSRARGGMDSGRNASDV